MKIHAILRTLLALLVLSSCGGSKQVATIDITKLPVPPANPVAVTMVGKKAELTEPEKRIWPHANLYKDSIPGMSLDEAHEYLMGKKPTKITVGIIDSGIDISHEDLRALAWNNPVDVPGNGIDEDNNGYADDAHGWNFLGGEKGQAVYATNGLTREYREYRNRFGDMDEADVPASEQQAYQHYLELKKEYDTSYQGYSAQYNQFSGIYTNLKQADKDMQEKLNKENYTLEDIMSLPEEDRNPVVMNVFKSGSDIKTSIAQIEPAVQILGDMVNKKYNLNYNGRVAGDNPDDINDTAYGNPWVIGSQENESHGTHVAGIMLGDRGNNKGVSGVTNDVQLIAVRAVPNGDEYDKDIALAIRYMADNGAKVVNMSFGKTHSKHPEWVYDAIKYAESKDVLLVKAAGNDGANTDRVRYYPTDAKDNVTEFCDNVITVGALSPYFDERMVGDYSNYGKINVDIFAPGTAIYSTVPMNKYDYKQGTSMASPAVAGLAALIRAYYPELSAKQVKHIILNSGLKVDMDVNVPKTEGKEQMPFSEFSKTGRIINALEAVKMADKMYSSK